MKQEQLMAMLALCLAIGWPTSELASLIVKINAAVFDVRKVATEADLRLALQQPEITTIVLTEHLIIESPIVINRRSELTLDLAGHNIVACRRGHGGFGLKSMRSTENACVLDIQAGNIELTGQGHIMALSADSTAIRVRGAMTADNANYSCLKIDRDIVLNAPNYYGLVVAASGGLAYGVKIAFAGTIIARDGIYIAANVQGRGDNLPTVRVESGAKILVDEVSGTAICAAGQGIWQLDSAIMAGANGILIEAGSLHLCGTAITASGTPATAQNSTNAEPTGYVVRFATQAHLMPPELTVAGGNYLSEHSYIFVADTSSTPIKKLEIKAGQFMSEQGIFQSIAPLGADNSVTAITGGQFASDISAYIATGYALEKSAKSKFYQVINVAESRAEAKEAQITTRFQGKLAQAAYYLDPKYVAGDLGPWRARFTPVLSTLKRINTSAHKLLDKKPALDKMLAATRSLAKAIKNVQLIEEDLRAEIMTAITSVEAIDVNDYTAYSYRELHQAATTAAKIMNQDHTTIEELYSSLLDIEINIDLLEERNNEESPETAEPIDPEELIIVSSALAAEVEVAKDDPEPAAEVPIAPPKLDAPRLGRITLAAMLPPTAKVEPPALPAPEPAPEPAMPVATAPISAPEPDATLVPIAAPPSAPTPEPVATTSAVDDTLVLARQNLSEMVAAVESLRINDYREDAAEQFGELQVAVAKATALLGKPTSSLEQIVAVMNEINAAISGLRDVDAEPEITISEPVAATTINVAAVAETVAVDWTALRDVVTEISRLDSNSYSADSYTWLLTCLESAKALVADPAVTQAQVDDVVFEINLAVLALEPVAAPRLSETETFIEPAASPSNAEPITEFNQNELNVTPNWLMSMMAGAYAGIAAYRSSRLAAKHRRRQA